MFSYRFPLLAGLAVLYGLFDVTPASAQVLSLHRPGFGNINLYRFQTMRIVAYNPLTGPVSLGFTRFGPPVAPAYYVNPYVGRNYLGGGVGNSSAYQEQSRNVARAQRAAMRDFPIPAAGRQAIANEWQYELRGTGEAAAVAGIPSPRKVDQFEQPPEPDPAEINSGRALNALMSMILPLDENAPRSLDVPFITPDLASRVQFTGNDTAESLNLIREARLNAPRSFGLPEFDPVRNDLSRNFRLLTEVAGQSGNTLQTVSNNLLKTVKQARELAGPVIREMSVSEAMELAGFFNRLEASAVMFQNPGTAAAYNPTWGSLGVSVRELLRHMKTYQLAFGPAQPGQEAAYETLYDALANYYMTLAKNQVARK